MEIPVLYGLAQKTIAGPLHRQVEGLIRSEIPDTRNTNVFDVGCGLGNYASLFSNAKYTGLDLDPGYIDHARKLFARPNVSFLVGDAVFPPQVYRAVYPHIQRRPISSSFR